MDFDTLVYLRDSSKFVGLDRLLLIEIELFATQDTHRAMPSVARLAHDLGVSSRWVQQRLRRLIDAGALAITHGTGRAHTNVYTLLDTDERVNSTSGFPGERVNSPRRKGELSDTERVNSTSPEVVEAKERKERAGRLLAQKGETHDRPDKPIRVAIQQRLKLPPGTRGPAWCEPCRVVHQLGSCGADAWASA